MTNKFIVLNILSKHVIFNYLYGCLNFLVIQKDVYQCKSILHLTYILFISFIYNISLIFIT